MADSAADASSREDWIVQMAFEHAQLMHLARLRFLSGRKSSGLLNEQITKIESSLGIAPKSANPGTTVDSGGSGANKPADAAAVGTGG